jgi:hypothetical protein
LTSPPTVKTLTVWNAAILLKHHASGFGGASAFSVAVFASPFVGAGFSTTGAAPLSPPPGASGVPGFFEQLQRATVHAADSDSAAETPGATPGGVNVPSKNVPATVPATAPVAVAKTAKPDGMADSKDEVSSPDSNIIVPSVKPTQSISGPPPVGARGSQRRVFPDDGTGAEQRTTAAASAADQSADLRRLIPTQVPASSGDSVIERQPSTVLLQVEGSITSTLPIQACVPSNPMAGQLAFAARIKPEGAAFPAQSHPASGASSNGHDDPAQLTVKSTGEASAKDGDPGHDEPENSAPPASGSPSSAAKASSASARKDEADSATNALEPNIVPLTQPIPQSMNMAAPIEPGLHANPAPADRSDSVPEPAHVLPDTPNQTTLPAKNISLQVEGASGQTVDIRIAARSGDLNVAVRSGDYAVAQDLRQGLGDLESRLAQSGYHAETWHPGHNGSTTEAAGSNSSNSPSQQQSQSGSGWSQQNRGQRDNNPSNRPRWVNQLTSTLKAESTEKGNANGIVA